VTSNPRAAAAAHPGGCGPPLRAALRARTCPAVQGNGWWISAKSDFSHHRLRARFDGHSAWSPGSPRPAACPPLIARREYGQRTAAGT